MEILAVLAINIVRILKYAIILRILLSWVQPHGHRQGGQLNRVLHEITEPVLRPARNLIPRIGMIDISPILVFFALDFLQITIVNVVGAI
jgi:YggT family protein